MTRLSDLLGAGIMVEGGDQLADRQAQEKRRLPLMGHIARLKDDVARLDEHTAFKEGDLVCWKKGLALHACGPVPFIFRRWLNPPIPTEQDSSSMYHLEPQDCVIAALVNKRGNDQDCVLVEWPIASRRLTLFTGEGEDNQGSA